MSRVESSTSGKKEKELLVNKEQANSDVTKASEYRKYRKVVVESKLINKVQKQQLGGIIVTIQPYQSNSRILNKQSMT